MIQHALDLAADSHPETNRSADAGLFVRDTAYHYDVSNPSLRCRGSSDTVIDVESPEPTYAANQPISKMCDLALYRKVVPSALRKRYRGQRNSTMSAKTSDVTNRKGWLGQKLWHSVMGFIDVKNDRFLRPFSMDTGEPHFLLSTKTARKTRGQLVQCVGEIMRRQHRLFLYSVVIVPRVRLIYWDRGGALVSEPFDVQQEGAKFLSFTYALGCMSDQALGSREVVLSTPRRRLRAQDGIRAINRSGFGPFSSPEFRLRPYLIEKHRWTLGSILFNIKRVAVAPPRSARRDWLRQTRLSIGA